MKQTFGLVAVVQAVGVELTCNSSRYQMSHSSGHSTHLPITCRPHCLVSRKSDIQQQSIHPDKDIRKRSADSYSSGGSGNDSGKGGSDDEACHEETSSELEGSARSADSAPARHTGRQPPPSDYVHLHIPADVATLSNYSYYCPGWNEQEITSNGSETLRRTKRVSFRLELSPNSPRHVRHSEQATRGGGAEYQTVHPNNKLDSHQENQSKNSKAIHCGEAVIFDLDLQRSNDVIV